MRKELWICDSCGAEKDFEDITLLSLKDLPGIHLCEECRVLIRKHLSKASDVKAESGAVGADVKAKTTPVPAAPPATTAPPDRDEQVRRTLEDSFWTPAAYDKNVSYKTVMQLEKEEIPTGGYSKARVIGDYKYWRSDIWCYREKVVR